MTSIGRSGMVEQVSRVPDQGRAPVTVIRASLWWLLQVLCSRMPQSRWVLTSAAWTGPCSHLLPAPGTTPIARHCQQVQVAVAGPNRPSGIRHLPLLLRGDRGSSRCLHLLTAPAPLTPAAGAGPNRSTPSEALKLPEGPCQTPPGSEKRAFDSHTGGRGNMKYGTCTVENEHVNQLQPQRVLLLQGTDSLNRAAQRIERSHRIATETDQIGSEIVQELGQQRDQLERTKNRLVNTNENLSKSRKILRSMSRKVTTSKLLLCVVIFLEIAILGGLVYYKFIHKH
ncbi:Vesicle transport through interaction with t-SNAREs like protein 1B [Myotis davidii]|uniref:Vesicle transport through interaction with t-SNAREs like protein 1B n=1 Tax=Myotis davidii TaxID=225400 RepID=L5M649_MYODS|nr:Vesicle transport through interaction with t-SNAREs like protein 1B [Myotis davidii]